MHERVPLLLVRHVGWVSALAALGLASGCVGGGRGATITRTVGGESRAGIFVSPFSYEHFLRGELAMLSDDLERAAEEYRLARAGPEDDPMLIARLADVTDRLGREDEAMQLLEQGDELDPDSELIALTRGAIHERHGRSEEAIEAYSRAAAAAPTSEAGPLALSALLRRLERPDDADAVLERYLARAAGAGAARAGAARARLALAVERGQAQAAAEAVRSLLDVSPARAEEVRAAAATALRAGRPELALQLLSALPIEAAEDRRLRLEAAIAAGDRDRAEGILARWMPHGPAELLQVADGYLAVGMPERAMELARVAHSADGGPAAQLVLGRALRQSGALGEAATVLANIDPASHAWPEAPIELGATLRDAGLPALAADVLSRAQRRRGSIPLALALAEARAAAGSESGALEALAGDDPRLRAARAGLLERFGRVDEADALYAALPVDDPALDPRDRARALAASRWREGDREGAIEALRAWTDRAPADLWSRARLAELLAAIDRDADAREIAGEALPLATAPDLRRRLTLLVTRGS